jgi:hypothetical protein
MKDGVFALARILLLPSCFGPLLLSDRMQRSQGVMRPFAADFLQKQQSRLISSKFRRDRFAEPIPGIKSGACFRAGRSRSGGSQVAADVVIASSAARKQSRRNALGSPVAIG